jgi:hypothetical protein
MTDQREESQSVTPGGPAPTRIRAGAELPAPPGMHPMGQLDARFPAAYEASAPAAIEVLRQPLRWPPV